MLELLAHKNLNARVTSQYPPTTYECSNCSPMKFWESLLALACKCSTSHPINYIVGKSCLLRALKGEPFTEVKSAVVADIDFSLLDASSWGQFVYSDFDVVDEVVRESLSPTVKNTTNIQKDKPDLGGDNFERNARNLRNPKVELDQINKFIREKQRQQSSLTKFSKLFWEDLKEAAEKRLRNSIMFNLCDFGGQEVYHTLINCSCLTTPSTCW